MFISVSVRCTAAGVPSDFEAENAACHFHHRYCDDRARMRFCAIKNHFLFRFLPFNLFQVLFTAVQIYRFFFRFLLLAATVLI